MYLSHKIPSQFAISQVKSRLMTQYFPWLSPFATQLAFDCRCPICLQKKHDSSPVTTSHKRQVPLLNFLRLYSQMRTRSWRFFCVKKRKRSECYEILICPVYLFPKDVCIDNRKRRKIDKIFKIIFVFFILF